MRKQDRYELLANSTPINKQAVIVVSQAGCDDNIFITDAEKLKVLGSQKRIYADKVTSLKREMRIKPNWDGKALPRYILSHSLYPELMDLRHKLACLDSEISSLRQKVKPKIENFDSDFVSIIKQKYPRIFEEVKGILLKNKQGE